MPGAVAEGPIQAGLVARGDPAGEGQVVGPGAPGLREPMTAGEEVAEAALVAPMEEPVDPESFISGISSR